MAAKSIDKSDGVKLWVRVVLGVSLALNLLVAGLVIGVMHGGFHPQHPPRAGAMSGPLTRALTHQDRRAIGREMRKAYRGTDGAHKGLREEFAGLVAELRAEPFDAAAVAGRLERQRMFVGHRLELGQRLLLERLAQMDTTERAAYADRLEQRLDSHWAGGRWHAPQE